MTEEKEFDEELKDVVEEKKEEKDFFREVLAEIDKKRKMVEEMEPEVIIVREAIPELMDMVSGHDGGCSAKVRGSLGYEFSTLHGVLLHCDIKDVAEVAPVLRWFGKRGYSQNGGEPEDYGEAGRRSYCLKNGDDKKRTIRVNFFFPSTPGAKCRFVQTGVEQKPVYELVCEDEETHSLQKQGAAV